MLVFNKNIKTPQRREAEGVLYKCQHGLVHHQLMLGLNLLVIALFF